MEGTDGWKLFGITKYEGLDPGRATIHRPADLLQDLVEATLDAHLRGAGREAGVAPQGGHRASTMHWRAEE
eukprot:3858466-Pyramimonas_sp.AAC.1